MRLCVMVEGQEGVTWDDWLALARATEELGFDALFRSDHYGPVVAEEELGSLDAWATLAALATVTTRIRLGTLVSPSTFRHPSVLAKNAVSVDHISGGRVEVGLGAGWNEAEHARYGFPFPAMGERMDVFAEQIEMIHGRNRCRRLTRT
jgi:alkanesulfonate monooxygenase SsuD/methylene tetrahydromethanopterin reductase-like flavin-dependent oxidoreductase (luciferase family)